MEGAFEVGVRVRVRADCPHTLPAYARMLSGVVLGPDGHGAVLIRFGEDHTFPVAVKWLVPAPADEPLDEADEAD